jgi:TonB family protein
MYALTHPGKGNAYGADVVEKIAWPEKGNPKPRYPDVLQRQGVEGSFVVEFVVDSTGKVDEKTLNFPSSTHPMFLRAVRDALLHSRFFPAELGGTHVRQLVQQQFSFVLLRN